MSGIIMGARYRLVKHPQHPVGIPKRGSWQTKLILVEWENPSLIPPSGYYPEEAFSDGTFEFLGYAASEPESPFYASNTSCNHKWKTYVGLREEFDYCETCNIKKGK